MSDLLFGKLNFQETVVSVERTKQSAERTKQTKPEDQPPIPRNPSLQQYRYRCTSCGTERLSDAEPLRRNMVYNLDCKTCGTTTHHVYQR